MKKRTILKAATVRKAMRLATPMAARRTGPFAAAADWAGEHLGGRFAPARRRSAGMGAAYGLGAAMLAIPLGMWVGRRVRGGGMG